MFTKIVDKRDTEIKYVYHLSDIHVRNIKRHEEYLQVFEKTFDIIFNMSSAKKKSSIIVITGDVVHSRSEISPNAHDITCEFLRKLSKILPVILIAGNHDTFPHHPEKLDVLTSIVKHSKDMKSIIYLKDRGFYQYHNIIFGLSDMYSDSPLPANTLDSDIYHNIQHQNKYLIALYHGPINLSKTDTGYQLKNKRYAARDFKGYDYGFFGDIHKFQYLNECKTMAYAGSLIQQSFGESLKNHGILLWNLYTRKSKLLVVPNDYGFVKMIVNKGILDTGNYVPKKPTIALIVNDTTSAKLAEIEKQIRNNYDVCSIITHNKIVNESTNKQGVDIKFNSNYDSIILKYLEKNKNTLLNDQLIDIHQKIYENVVSEGANVNPGGKRWEIVKITFDDMFSYGKNNVVSFDIYDKNQIIGIVAPNHYGKSAILDVILFCLFKVSSRGNAESIMNNDMNTMACSLTFNIGDDKYKIDRSAKRGKLRVNVTTILYCNEVEVKHNLEADAEIVNLVGTFDDYLTSYICVQDADKKNNFIGKTNAKKKQYLCDILKLSIFDECYKVADKKIKNLKISIKSKQENLSDSNIEKLGTKLSDVKLKISNYERQKKMLEKMVILLDSSSIDQPTRIVYNEFDDVNTIKDILSLISDLKTKVNDYSDTIDYSKNIDDKQNEINTLIDKKILFDNYDLEDILASISECKKSLANLHQKMSFMGVNILPGCAELELELRKEFNDFVNSSYDLIIDCKDRNVQKSVAIHRDMINKYVSKVEHLADHEKIIKKYQPKYIQLMTDMVLLENKKNVCLSQKNDLEHNNKINNEIDLLKQELVGLTAKLEDSEKNKSVQQEYRRQLSLAEIYFYSETVYILNKHRYDEYITNKNILERDINKLDNQLYSLKIDYDSLTEDKSKYTNLEKEIALLESELELYNQYKLMVHPDGVPHLILQKILPEIEMLINNILSDMVDFKVEFVYQGNENNNSNKKYRNKKSLSEIDVHIRRSGKKSCPCTCGSGFEKFVTGLAIRIAFCDISNSAKPNFFIIDEGWSCLDSDNIANVDKIMSIIESKFDHVIMISHLEQIKDLAFYTININRKKSVSYVNNQN